MNGPGTFMLRAVLLATSSLVAAGAMCPANAAGPGGGQVVVGHATITHPNADETLIDQSTNKALIDWSSFSVPAGYLVDFKQPGRSSLTVNDVTGPNASVIEGDLLANGALWIINGNGIVFEHGSEINVGALLATTSDISDSDVEDGHYAFSKSSNPNASVVNRGTIRAASGGSVVLSAPVVSNQGVIQANLGKAVLGGASAFTVDMVGDNLIRYQITTPVSTTPKYADGKAVPALVSNSGTISADGGKVLMTASAAKGVQDDVINNTGVVEATSVSSHDGEIDLDAGPNGTVNAGGTLDASGNASGEKGGTIEIAGNTVHVENGATLNASGDTGGGTVLVGGGFHGKGPIADAATTLVGNATIDVDATGKGNGGKVAVWSDRRTVFAGTIDAHGGQQGGNGGYIETSSGVSLQVAFDAVVNASAQHGSKGSWLLDPLNIIIETGGTTELDNGVLGLNQDGGKTDTIDPGTITAALGSTNVLLEAANDITVLNDVVYKSTNSLLLLAEHDINAFANIQNELSSAGGGVYLIAGWNGVTTSISQLTHGGVYGNNDGSVFVGTFNAPGNVAVGSASGPTVVAGDNVTVEADNGYAQIGYAGAGDGNISVLATGNITVSDLYELETGFEPDAQIGNGGINVSNPVSGNINVQAGGSITILDDSYASDVNCNDCYYGFSVVGNMGGPNSHGNIVLNAGGDLSVDAEGEVSTAQIGNISLNGTDGGLTGTIDISAANISLLADGALLGRATIGQDWDFAMTGETGGNIDITADSLTVTSESGPNSGLDQARITNRGAGNVFGNVNVDVSGNISLTGNGDATVTEIGDVTVCGSSPCGTTTGDITVQAGGSISIIEQNNGNARIEDGGGAGNDITVTAGGDITLEASNNDQGGNGDAMIGVFDPNSGGGDKIDVTSTGGSINLDARGTYGIAYIGNSANGLNVPTSGNITLSAPEGNISLVASGGATAQVGNMTAGAAGSVSGNVDVTAGGDIAMEGGQQTIIGNTGNAGEISGSVTLSADSVSGFLPSFYNDIVYGNFTFDFTGTQTETSQNAVDYSSPYTLTVVTGGDLTFDASLVNSGKGAIDLTSAGTITIGGAGAKGNVAVGSAGGTTTINAADLVLAADNGYAQLGFDGIGSGDIDVTTTGSVTLDGGASANEFAQIGNGGYQTSGSESGDITITAGGDITLSGGSGALAYVQIGNGGAESNQNSKGYDDSGMIQVKGDHIALDAGSGNAAYGQIGNGGYEVGKGLTGNGINSGDIIITAVNSVTLDGKAADAYAQIGNGGDQINLDASAAASGGAIGDVTVTVTTSGGDVDLTAGAGSDAYVQIGDGGFAEDSPNGNVASFTTGGDVTITASNVSLAGGNSGSNAYAQIGNGDASQFGDAKVAGNVVVSNDATISKQNGTATDSPAIVGNETGGEGNGGNSGGNQQKVGPIDDLTQSDTAANDILLTTFDLDETEQPQYQAESALEVTVPSPSPLEQMANASSNGDNSYEGSEPSDDLVVSLGGSLDPAKGRKKSAYVTTRTLVPGVLKQVISSSTRNPHGIPPADEDYSSWGNEALWK